MKNKLLIISMLIVCGTYAFTNAFGQQPNKSQPNIVLIFADDLGWADVSTNNTTMGNGSKIYNTPNIDRIATEGMSFTHAYTQQNCAPSRASLVTGQYATGVDNDVYNVTSLERADNSTKGYPNLPIQPYKQRTFITADGFSIWDMLQTKGYYTTLVGKSHGTPHPINGADYGIDLPADIHHIITEPVNGEMVESYYLAVNSDNLGWTFKSEYIDKYAQPYDQKYINEILDPFKTQSDLNLLQGTAKHMTDAIGDFSVDFVKEKASSENPFFLYVPFHAVHTNVVGRMDLTAKYLSKGLDVKTAEYASLIELLDQNIGKISNALQDPNGDGDFSDNITDNTLLIIYSDNGSLYSNVPLAGKKAMLSEGGIRVPLICKFPGVISPNSISSQAVHCIDFYPTLADFAGVDVSTLKKPNGQNVSLDGESFADILKGNKTRLNRKNLFWHLPGYLANKFRPSTLIQTRIGDVYYKLFYFYETSEFTMYNLTNDLGETKNLLENPSFEQMEIALAMNHDMLEWLQKNNAPTGTWVADGSKVSYPKEDGVMNFKSLSNNYKWTTDADFMDFSPKAAAITSVIADNQLKLTIRANYPTITYNKSVNVDRLDKFRIVLKNETSSSKFGFVWYKNGVQNKISFAPAKNNSTFQEYIVDLSANTAWLGDIESFYIETAYLAGSGTVTIDTIEFVPKKGVVEQHVTVTVEGEGRVNPKGSGTCLTGQVVEFGAFPLTGYKFAGWSGDVTSSDNPLILTLNSDLNFTANFIAETTSVIDLSKPYLDCIAYPNPANESLNVINVPLGATISIVSIQGKQIKKLKTNESSVFIDVSNVKPGTYFLSVRNQSANFSFKVIIS